jgi:YegS/Rv2252/BmrU family lipid kinase
MKCLFIYNPLSGKNKKLMKKMDYIEKKLKEKYKVVDIVPTQYAGHAIDLAREACGKYNALIFSGGDGTFSEVVKGIGENKQAPMIGFIPSGTVSDMANNYKIPRNIKKAIDVCVDGSKTKIDVCKINDSYFAYASALGTYVGATFKTSPKMKKKYGRMAYFLQGAKEVFKVNEQKIEVTVGQKTFTQDSILTMILNTKSVAGFSRFNYQNKLGDGKFDVVIVKKPAIKTPFNVWKLFAMGVNKCMDNDNVMVFSADKISINVNEDVDWNLDGDAFRADKIDVSCLKKRLTLFVPKA